MMASAQQATAHPHMARSGPACAGGQVGAAPPTATRALTSSLPAQCSCHLARQQLCTGLGHRHGRTSDDAPSAFAPPAVLLPLQNADGGEAPRQIQHTSASSQASCIRSRWVDYSRRGLGGLRAVRKGSFANLAKQQVLLPGFTQAGCQERSERNTCTIKALIEP